MTQTEPSLIDRYQNYRIRRFLKHERTYARALPSWRTQHRRRILVVALSFTFVFMFAVSLLCAFGIRWAPLLWLPACLLYTPLWLALHVVSGRQGDAPEGALDEYEVQQRNTARSIGLTVTQTLMLLPALYLVFGSVFTWGTGTDVAYAGSLMVVTVLSIGGCMPAMILGWTRPDPDL
jgi:cation transport ATPase